MVFVRSIALAAALLAGACTPAVSPSSFSPDTSVIVDHDLFNRATCGRMSGIGGSNWTPTATMIERLESALMARLIPELEVDAAFYEHDGFAPSDYVRRYSGFSLEGRPLIAICGEHPSIYERGNGNWRTNPIPFRDGGSSSFGAIYDPITNEITYFEFGYNA